MRVDHALPPPGFRENSTRIDPLTRDRTTSSPTVPSPTRGIAKRNGAEGMPSESPVESADPILRQVVGACHRGVLPGPCGSLGVIGMDKRDPVPFVVGFSRAARVVRALPVGTPGVPTGPLVPLQSGPSKPRTGTRSYSRAAACREIFMRLAAAVSVRPPSSTSARTIPARIEAIARSYSRNASAALRRVSRPPAAIISSTTSTRERPAFLASQPSRNAATAVSIARQARRPASATRSTAPTNQSSVIVYSQNTQLHPRPHVVVDAPHEPSGEAHTRPRGGCGYTLPLRRERTDRSAAGRAPTLAPPGIERGAPRVLAGGLRPVPESAR